VEAKPRNPWWIVFGAVTGLLVCNGPVLGFTFGVFLKPIMHDMGWDRGTTSFAMSVGGVLDAMLVPAIGLMMDRWSIRRVALPGIVIYAVALALVGLAPHSLLIFALMMTIAGGASAIQTPIGYVKAIAAWFDRRRGLALGITMSGVGLGGFIMPQLAEALIQRSGWRGAYPTLALLTLVVAFPTVAILIREPRPGEGEQPRPAVVTKADLPGLSAREAAATARFWIMLAMFFLVAIAINGPVGHIVPLLTDKGMSPVKAAAMMGLFGLATMCGRLLAGYLVDRFAAAHVATVLWLAPIAGFVLLESAGGVLPAAGVILLGLGLGTEMDLMAFLVSRYFGQRAFGQLYGFSFMLFGFGSSAGRGVGGYVYDLAHSYTPGLIGAAVALVVAVVLVHRLGPYTYAVRVHRESELAVQPAVS
jgi:predicted MFS family arabinose efflux permease